jgi:uncharacterized membrane protein YdfJ with MMPL/SSD domain
VFAFVAAGAIGGGFADRLDPYGADDPSTESVAGDDRLDAAGYNEAGAIVLMDGVDVGSREGRQQVQRYARQIEDEPEVAEVASFYTTGSRAFVSHDGDATYLTVRFTTMDDDAEQDAATRIVDELEGKPGITVGGGAVASEQVNTQVEEDLRTAELYAFPLLFLLSLLFFRSLVAALLPLLVGAVTIVSTLLMLTVASELTSVSIFALNLVTGLGLGLAIDYSLFMVSRYREEAAAEGFGVAALRRTLQTSGRTIIFSSLTIAAAIASLTIFPQRFLYSMGIGGALVALLAASLALVVLPALLTVLGPRVNALAPRWLARAAEREARPDERGPWYRISRFVMRRPAPIAVAGAALLIALGTPFAGVKFIDSDAGVLPASASSRQVNDTLNRQFPPNRTAPLEVVVGAPAGSPQVRALAARIRTLPDVSAVAPAQPAGAGTSLLAVAPVHGPLTTTTRQLVKRVRAIDEPFSVGVAGQTASFVDLEHSLGSHLPAVLGVVVAATLIVLFLLTGSVVLPVKAVLMNALNLSAVFGILVLIFQHGNLEGLLGYHSTGALDATQPILLFAVAFGLSTDYGVFLLSRIKEARDTGAPNSEAVAIGLERTGRIVTAAALLFAVAIGAFATSKIVFIKELGIGNALAVLIDASIVRALLVPSLMGLLGSANWWAPRPLRRVYQRFGWRDYGGPLPAVSN